MFGKINEKLVSAPLMAALIAIVAILLVFAITLSLFIIIAKPFSADGGGLMGNLDTYPFRQNFKFAPASSTEDTLTINSESINSQAAVVVDLTDNKIVASRKSEEHIYPASMTKVMTLIVVYENLKNEDSLNEQLVIEEDVVQDMVSQGSSGYGLKAGERLTVKDLIYDMILQSDNIACVTLARYISGSESEFVKLMNEKAKDMGLLDGDSDTNPSTQFVNSHGLHHRYHHTTCKDMANIMSYAMQNTFCAEVLTTLSYTPGSYFRPGDNAIFYNAFLVTDLQDGNPKLQPKTFTFKAGKTGYTDESLNCLVSYAKHDKNGDEYIVVTSGAPSADTRRADHIYLYDNYGK